MKNATQFFPLDYTALPLRTFGVHFRHTGSGIRVRFYDAQVGPGGDAHFRCDAVKTDVDFFVRGIFQNVVC